MEPYEMRSRIFSWPRSLLTTASVCTLAVGCASAMPIHQSAQGAVYLEEAYGWSFAAAHPVSFDPFTIEKVLRGVQIDESGNLAQKVSMAVSNGNRVFSDEDAAFLAPQLAVALSRATPEQIVSFQVVQTTVTGPETTAGTLYAEKFSLYLTITQYQGKTWTSGLPSLFSDLRSDSEAIDSAAVTFVPEGVARVQKATESASLGQSNLSSVVIDKNLLAKQTPTQTKMEVLTMTLEELRQNKEMLSKKDSELKAMSQDIDFLRSQLAKRKAEIKTLKEAKGSAKTDKKKSAPVTQFD